MCCIFSCIRTTLLLIIISLGLYYWTLGYTNNFYESLATLLKLLPAISEENETVSLDNEFTMSMNNEIPGKM
jgi:hypothetical protein